MVQQFKVKIPGRVEVLKVLKSVAAVKTGHWVQENSLPKWEFCPQVKSVLQHVLFVANIKEGIYRIK